MTAVGKRGFKLTKKEALHLLLHLCIVRGWTFTEPLPRHAEAGF